MIDKVNKAILILYNVCGVSLVVLAAAGMTPPVGWLPRPLIILGIIPFILLLIAHLTRYMMKRNSKTAK
ncbi:hypothetical protein [Enterococcus sp. AZ109]|uniref:hypothetical protein n=1 Tax=Enterococcus sp. AZ109 TaxID=2774634 RepID=UPI003F293101